MMKIIENGSITNVKGIKATGITAGLKKSGKKDLALIYSEYAAVSAAVFTKNLVKAAPILVDMENIKSENTLVSSDDKIAKNLAVKIHNI